MNMEFTARLFDELESLYPDSDAGTGKTQMRVSGANGTYAGVQILLNGLTPGVPVSVEVEGPHTAFRLFEMLPVPVEVNTGAKQRSAYLHDDVNDSVIRKAPFYVYEVLKPMYNLLMPSGVSAAVTFRSAIEYAREIREEEFRITVSHAGKVQLLRFTVTLYPCTVPRAGKDTHRLVNWISYSNVAKYHAVKMDTPEYFRILERYLRMAVYLRQNFINLPLEMFLSVKKGVVALDEKRLDRYIAFLRKCGIELFHGTAFCARSEGQGDNDQFYNSLEHDKITSPEEIRKAFRKVAFDKFDNGTRAKVLLSGKDATEPEAQRVLRAAARKLYRYLLSRNLTDAWQQCLLDEPNDALSEHYKIISRIVREEMPGIKIMEPVLPTHAVAGALDIWCPTVETYELDRDFYEERVRAGDELYVYTCLTPGGRYLNRMLDMQRLRSVYLGWAPAKYASVSGFLHWGYNQYLDGQDPYNRSACMFSEGVVQYHPKRDLFLPAGDFAIVYPGFNTVYSTTRGEAQRIGLEDLCLLETLSEEKRLLIVEKVFRGYADYETDIEKYREAKELLLKEAAQ